MKREEMRTALLLAALTGVLCGLVCAHRNPGGGEVLPPPPSAGWGTAAGVLALEVVAIERAGPAGGSGDAAESAGEEESFELRIRPVRLSVPEGGGQAEALLRGADSATGLPTLVGMGWDGAGEVDEDRRWIVPELRILLGDEGGEILGDLEPLEAVEGGLWFEKGGPKDDE
jgi:hypothetical protein